ncbi:MAG: ATP-binding protein, partial [bacterium]|nr:ATP-binding protein [bacterium]
THIMALPATITSQVGASLITRVTRLFNGTIQDVLNELLQNSRRAGATGVTLELQGSDGAPILVVTDDGSGIDDPAALLTLGYSGWDDAVAHREDPAGMGMFSLAGRQVEIRSWSRRAGRGWMVQIPEQGWHSLEPLTIQPCPITSGTQLRIALPEAWARNLLAAAKNAARYFPLSVTLSGTLLPREDFLAEAVRVDSWQGCRIGIFSWRGHQPIDIASINFHGVTVPCDLPFVSEVGKIDQWCVKVDIIDAPDLQLVLPARKEMVRNAALDVLKKAAETAIYRMIRDKGEHRLGYTEWTRARALGIMLPLQRPGFHAGHR